MPATVTFFQIGACVHLEPAAGHGDVDGELIGIGRIYLAIRVDGGAIDRRVWDAKAGSSRKLVTCGLAS